MTSTSKAWTYWYLNAPNFGGDVNYDGSNGVMNDGLESYYGDSVVGYPVVGYTWGPYWGWWNQYDDPSIVIDLPYAGLSINSVAVHYSHGIGGGVTAPASFEALYRVNSSTSWASVGSTTPPAAIGWATLGISPPQTGGELRVDLTAAGEHTILSELSIQGSCSASP